MSSSKSEIQLIEGRLIKKFYENDILVNIFLFPNYFHRDSTEFIDIANAGKILEPDWGHLESFIETLVKTIDSITPANDPVVKEYSKTELIKEMDKIHAATIRFWKVLYKDLTSSLIFDLPKVMVDEEKLISLPLTKLNDFSAIWKDYYQEDLDPWDSYGDIENEPIENFQNIEFFLYFLEKKSALLKAIIQNELYYDISPYTNIKIKKKEKYYSNYFAFKDILYASSILKFWKDDLNRDIKIVNRSSPTYLTKFSQKIFLYVVNKKLTFETIEEKLKRGKNMHKTKLNRIK